MLNMKLYHYIAGVAAIAALGSCSHSPHWTLSGSLPAGTSDNVVIESMTFNGWLPVDTVTVDGSGRFRAEGTPKGYPDIYRLVTASGETAYFPVDSLETVTLTATAGSDGRLVWRSSGSSSASIMTSADSLIAAYVAANGVDAALTDSLLKRELSVYLLTDPSSVAAYYLVNKRLSGQPLFNPLSRTDLRLIGAVANAYSLYKPGNPRTRELTDLFVAAKRAVSPVQRADTLHAVQIGHHEIELYDSKGNIRRLGDEVEAGKLTILNFTAYGAEESPALNILLNDVYERYSGSGLRIYQVCLDPDEPTWRMAAGALPWVSVYNSPVTGATTLMKYNVTAIPTTYLIDSSGEIVERIDDLSKLQAAVARRMK